MRTLITSLATAALALPLLALGDGGAIPQRPEKITFGGLKFETPDPAQYRHTLKDGTVVYLAPSHEFPLINLSMTFKGGSNLDPADMVGLAAMTGRMVRDGGTATMKPGELDEAFDFMATQAGAGCAETTSSANLNCLKNNFDESLKLFVDMLRNPGFDTGRLETNRGQAMEGMKQRNDDAKSIIGREWSALLYGREHFEARQATEKGLKSITPDAMRTLHKRIFNPGNAIVAVSGDFEPKEMLAKLEKAFDGWERGPVQDNPVAPTATLKPGLYHVQKDIPQGKVQIGLRAITRDDPDYIPFMMLNDILGGGGFTSRIMTQVRSNEGLAYSAGSRMTPKVYYPGEWRGSFESKSPTVALATRIVLEEMQKIRDNPVTDEELETTKKQLIETFPRTFESKPAMLGVFVGDEWTNRPKDFWKTFRDKVNATTKEDLQRVAKKYLDPKQVAILVVGDWNTIGPGDLNGRAKMSDLFGGSVTHLPLRDPLTMEPIAGSDQMPAKGSGDAKPSSGAGPTSAGRKPAAKPAPGGTGASGNG